MLTKLLIASFSLIASAALAGCASTASPSDGAKGAVAEAMMCPKCESVWFTRVTDQGLKTQRMVSEKKMVCPDCDATAEAYFQDGKKVLHNCPSCQVTLIPVKPAPVASPRGPRSF